MARESGFLPIKISFYVPLYESLFSILATEISHQVSERVAFYMKDSYELEAEKIYKIVRDAYNVRSRFLHGEKLNTHKLVEQQKQLALDIDSLTREVLKKALVDGEKFRDDEYLRDWLPKIMFDTKK